MHMTRPYFPGRSALARIVDNENTITNIRKEKEEKIRKAKENRKNYSSSSYKISGGTIISKNIVDTFHKTGDVSQLVKMKNRTAKNILDHAGFLEALEKDDEYVNCLINYIKFVINKYIDSSLYIDVANHAVSVIYSKMIRAYKNVYNTFLNNEIETRRNGTM